VWVGQRARAHTKRNQRTKRKLGGEKGTTRFSRHFCLSASQRSFFAIRAVDRCEMVAGRSRFQQGSHAKNHPAVRTQRAAGSSLRCVQKTRFRSGEVLSTADRRQVKPFSTVENTKNQALTSSPDSQQPVSPQLSSLSVSRCFSVGSLVSGIAQRENPATKCNRKREPSTFSLSLTVSHSLTTPCCWLAFSGCHTRTHHTKHTLPLRSLVTHLLHLTGHPFLSPSHTHTHIFPHK
jgi:hypothetical protein